MTDAQTTQPHAVPAASDPATIAFEGAQPSILHDLRTLILSRVAAISLETDDEERAEALLSRAAQETGLMVAKWSLASGVTFVGSRDFVPDSKNPAKALKAMAAHKGGAIFILKDFSRHLSDPMLAREFYELIDHFQDSPSLSTIAVVDAVMALPDQLTPMVSAFDIKLPEPAEYVEVITRVIGDLLRSGRTSVEIGADHYAQIAQSLRGLTLNQARQAIAQVAIDDGRLSLDDLARLVEIKADQLQRGGVLELIPAGALEAELGGFENLRNWLARQREAFSPAARELNLPEPKGLMLVGVQGCGKSLAAKAVARSWTLPLVRLDVGRLYEKYVGESEKNFREAITVIESLAPAVLWIDEIEKAIMPGGGETDGGLSRRLFGAFLTWLQEKHSSVFVVATANDLSLLPPELLRKGRFDEIFFVDLPGPAERAEIFRIHLELRKQDPSTLDVAAMAAATAGFSGAEIEHVVVSTLLAGLQKNQRPDTAAYLAVAAQTIPLSTTRREEIDRLRATASGRFVAV